MNKALLAFLSSLVLFVPMQGMAALGAPVDAIASDVKAQHAVAGASKSLAAYGVQQMTLPSSTVVTQYISPAGVVFAVRWEGPRPPDLSQMMGTYFAEYQAVASRPHRRATRSHVETANIVYDSAGHMGHLQGIAYLPALLPSGVTVLDLK